MADLSQILSELFLSATGSPAQAATRVADAPEVNLDRMTYGAGRINPAELNQPGTLNASVHGGAATGRPDINVPAGMSVGSALPVSEAVKNMLARDTPAPDRRMTEQIPTGGRMLPMEQPMPRPAANPQAAPAAITGEDVARFIRSVAMGAARVNPSSPIGSAIAQGAAGSLSNSYGERQMEQQRAEQRDRFLRQDALRAEREGRLMDQQIETARRNAARDQRQDALTDARLRQALEREKQLAARNAGVLRPEDLTAIETNLRRQAEALQRDGRPAADIEKHLASESRRLAEQYKRGRIITRGDMPALENTMPAPGAAAPAPAQGYTVNQFQPGQVVGGYRFKGGDPTDQNNYEKIGQ